jgi:hypothetical protein
LSTNKLTGRNNYYLGEQYFAARSDHTGHDQVWSVELFLLAENSGVHLVTVASTVLQLEARCQNWWPNDNISNIFSMPFKKYLLVIDMMQETNGLPLLIREGAQLTELNFARLQFRVWDENQIRCSAEDFSS